MTGREIAAVAQVSARTVHRVASELYPDKHCNGHRTSYSREEAVAIMGKLRKPGFVAPAPDLAKMTRSPRQNGKLPAGIQLRELRLIYGPEEARRRLDLLIGFEAPQAPALPPPEPIASDSEATMAFAELKALFGDKGARQVMAVTRRIGKEEAERREADRKQGRLL